ncbi:hypothetical protein VaNZ11_012767 [Volvox africanus]|uniref:SBP-type domain-containing protein n=1 Tax=Volvox africanus TaxID=51714 RepID=A0ABQ5SFC9_9CHLO|nr:hypothetical protein VaNZ11_012767 [Volvox africanus]
MASEADLELWDIDIDQSSVPGQPDAWTLAGYTWDPVGLVATRKAGLSEPRRGYVRDANPSTNPSGDNDSGGSNENFEPGMEVELRDDAPVIDPDVLASAPVYLPQPPGCKAIICQVAGCGMCLEGMKGYFLRHRVCEEHSKAPMLIIGDVPSRLCQQCSKFHHVSAFEGSKRTCRVQLDRIRINKRIRRNRKLNAATSAALAAAAGFQDDDDGTVLGELPARPASVFGGGAGSGRAKRPADSSGSGEGSWVHSRKSSRHGGAASGAARGAGSGTRGAGVGNGIGGDMQAATLAAAAAAAAAAGAAILNDQEALPESGASDTGSREHPRGSLGVSGSMRWPQLGTQSSAVIPRSPPSAAAPASAVAAMAGMFGGAGSGVALAQSPASAATSGSGSGAAGLDAGCMQHSGFSYSQQQQPMYQPAQRMASLDSLPMSAAEVGGPGSIAAAAAAAAAASFVNESKFTAPLRNHSLPVGLDLASLVGQQESAVAAHMHGLAFATGSPVEAFSGSGVQPLPGQTAGVSSIAAAAACLSTGLPRQDAGGSNGAAPEMTSLLSTTAPLTGDISEGAAATTAAAAADQQLAPQRRGSLGGEASPGPETPLSATSLHPLLQQQLQQELLLHQQRFQQQHQQHQQHQQQHQQILDQHQGSLQQFQVGSIALLQGSTVSSGTGRSLNNLTDSAQQANARLCRQQQLLIPQQKLQQQPAAATWASAQLDIPIQLEGSRDLAEAALVATSAAATAGRRPTEAQLAAAARTAVAGTAPLPAQAAAVSQLSGPSNVTGGSGLGGSNALRSMSHCGDGSGGGDAADGGGRVTHASHPSCGTNTLSSSKLVRMSLENDTTLDDSGVLLGNLIDLLQTQAAEPRDGTTDPRVPWSAGPARIAPSAFSEPGSHGSGNGSLAASAAAAVGNGFGAGVGGSLTDSVCGVDLAAALGDMGSTAALSLSRGGSGCVGSPQNATMLTAAAAVAAAAAGTSRLGSLEAMAVGLPGAVLAGTRGGSALLIPAGLGSGAGASLPVPVPGTLAAAAACGNRMLDGSGVLSSPGFAAQLQEQVLRAPVHPLAATSDLLLQHQLLLAQQQQQQQQQQLQLLQQQQLLRLQQAQAQAQAQAAPSVPAAGLLLSRLLDADTKTHHLSTELNGCLAEKQLLRRQLLVTLSTCQGAAAEQLAAAAMAAGGTSNAAAATATAVPTSHLSPSALGPQLPMQRPLLGGLGVTSAGLGAAPGLVLGAAGGLGSYPALAAGAGELVGTAGGLGAVGLGASGLRPGAMGVNTAGAPGLDMQQMLQMSAGGMGIAAASAPAVALGSTSSGMLGATGRPTAAAQLHALAEARAVAAAGAVGPPCGSGVGAATSYTAPDLLTRVSLKIMNCLPDELPSDIRSRMQAFASQAPLDLVQGCLRPGCTEVVLDALHCGDEAWLVSELLRSGDADAAAAALLSALPPALHSKDIYLQAADQALCLRPGAPPRHACWAGMGIRRGGLRMDKPVLLAAESMVVHLNGADMESCVRVRVYGKHLTSPGVTFLARMAGLALEVKIRRVGAAPVSATTASTALATDGTVRTAPPQTQQDVRGATAAAASSAISVLSATGYTSLPPPPSGAPETCTADIKPLCNTGSEELYDAFDVEVQLPYNAPPQGLLILEPRAGVLLGGWAPVLLVEDAAVAADVEGLLRGLEPDQARRLVVSLSMFVDHAERCAAVLEAGEQQHDEGKEREPSLGFEGEMEEVQEEEPEGGFDGTMVEEKEDTEDGAASHADVWSGSPSCWEEIFGSAHRRVVRMGHTLLAYSALRACPQLMSYLGAQLMEMGEPLSALPSASYNGMELLPCAVLSGFAPVISIAVAWAARGGAAVSWRAQVPGQPSGVNLLHLAAVLPLNVAVHTLDLLWALATSTPAAADAFACAWFDDGAAAFDAPSLLFHTAVSNTAAIAISTSENPDTVAEASVSGHMMADNLDKVCLLQLASSYIRTHNYMSPLDNVELPSVEVSSAAMSTAAADNEACGKPPQHCTDDGVQDLDPGAVVAALRNSRRTDVKVLPTINANSPSSGLNAAADHSGHGSTGGRPDLYEPLAALAASGCWAAALAGSSSSDTAGGPGELYGTQPLMAVTSAPMAAPMPTPAPSRMRVSVAPKALAQAAAAAGNQLAAANLHPSDGSNSWLPGSGSGAADASCVPPSYTTNATTTLFPSGSLPAFASGMTMAGMPPYASSLASYYSQMTAAQGVPVGKPPSSMEPLLDMFRPLPESPSLGPENCGAIVAAAADTASGSLPPIRAQPRRENNHGGGFGDADIDAAAAAVPQGGVSGGLRELDQSGFGLLTGPVSAVAAAVGDGDRLWHRMESVGDADGPTELSQQHMLEGAAGTVAAATSSKVGLGDPGLTGGAGGGVSSAAAAVAATEPGSEKLRGHMRGLARMFKRLFKKGVPGGEGLIE